MKKHFILITLLFLGIPSVYAEGWIKTEENIKYELEENTYAIGKYEIDGDYYYFNEDGIMQTGFIPENEKIYFYSRVNGKLKHGWQGAEEGQWYQDEEGALVVGKTEIDGKNYYFNENGFLQKGFIPENGKIYFYSRVNGALKHGWQGADEGQWYQDEEGALVVGKTEIDGKNYYFNENGFLQKGFITENGKIYFYSRVNGALKHGWQGAEEGKWYQNEEGEVVTKEQQIDGKNYYFNDQGIMQTGFIEKNDKIYFYSRVNGALKKGLQGSTEGAWYQKEDGEVLTGEGLVNCEEKEFFIHGKFLEKGIIQIDDKNYYFDENNYTKQYGVINKNNYRIYLDSETGEYIRTQQIPVYYKQKDSRWTNKKYGKKTFGSTGCSPTSMAMAFTSILNREILPTEIGDYLYNNTDQFNKKYSGTSGLGIIYASDHYHVKWKGINSKEELIGELKQGKIVYGTMQNGKFATERWNHAIVMYDYKNESKEKTYTLDPLNENNNGWTNIDLIWKEQCQDPDDRLGGFTFYSLEKE